MNTQKAGITSRAKAAKLLTVDELFFFDHAGWSYDPKKQTAQAGRIECAKLLAEAERVAHNMGWHTCWEFDDISYEDALGDHTYWCRDAKQGKDHEHTIEQALLMSEEGEVLASLGAIIDAHTNYYRRVVAAELALEASHRLDEEIEIIDAH